MSDEIRARRGPFVFALVVMFLALGWWSCTVWIGYSLSMALPGNAYEEITNAVLLGDDYIERDVTFVTERDFGEVCDLSRIRLLENGRLATDEGTSTCPIVYVRGQGGWAKPTVSVPGCWFFWLWQKCLMASVPAAAYSDAQTRARVEFVLSAPCKAFAQAFHNRSVPQRLKRAVDDLSCGSHSIIPAHLAIYVVELPPRPFGEVWMEALKAPGTVKGYRLDLSY